MSISVGSPGTKVSQSIADILESIALEEAALEYIMVTEGEKVKRTVLENGEPDIDDTLAVRNSVNLILMAVFILQALLQFKLETVTKFMQQYIQTVE